MLLLYFLGVLLTQLLVALFFLTSIVTLTTLAFRTRHFARDPFTWQTCHDHIHDLHPPSIHLFILDTSGAHQAMQVSTLG